jgi:hypothetical protein
MMFSIVFLLFNCLFYLLFHSNLWSSSSLFQTSGMLFEMALMKFNAQELSVASAVLGPLSFSLYILLVVFVCLSMFITIINHSFQHARDQVRNDHEKMFSYMFDRFLRWTG